MSTEHAAMLRVRSRVRREIAEAEESEHEGGEINLVPYLDIVVNTVIFMLATSALSIAMGNINVSAPRYSAVTTAGDEPDNKPKLNLTVAITYTGFHIAGSAAVLPKIPCKLPLRAGRCPANLVSRTNDRDETVLSWSDGYNYSLLAEKLKEVKLFKRGTQFLYRHERQAILTADRRVPYNVVVRTMDAIRGEATANCTGEDGCLFDQVVLSAGVQ